MISYFMTIKIQLNIVICPMLSIQLIQTHGYLKKEICSRQNNILPFPLQNALLVEETTFFEHILHGSQSFDRSTVEADANGGKVFFKGRFIFSRKSLFCIYTCAQTIIS